VPEHWVVNASPLITLAKARHLALLTALATEVLIPEAVVAEVRGGPATDPARQALESGWGTRVAVPSVPIVLQEWGLGAGETAVLAVALARGECTAILDDAASRRCARTLGVPVMGTLGVVVRAKHHGHIASAALVMRALRAAGLYIDDALLTRVLRESVGETWRP
jgi:predicted nucleic acid-binding protein